uniref:amidase n=1 Tax=Bionectria ochroleuca TaxID=29856 RepID=A0A8H7N2E8_BIOOC
MASQPPTSPTVNSWQTKAAEKRAACQEAIPKDWILPQSILETLPAKSDLPKTKVNLIDLDIPRRSGILTEREIEITESFSTSQLLEGLASGKFTSYEVTLAFSKRAAIVQQLVGCLTETFFKEALERAKYLDELRSKGKLLGPLHGLPISLKDTYQVEGTQATIGAVSFLNRTSQENSSMVEVLLELGAVLYVKTNVAQILLAVESDNNVFGRTLNPWNTMLTAGGSSGGEGALVAFRGTPLGVGTDLAGSIRIPSLCCGVYGLRATADRLPFGKQVMPSSAGIWPVKPTAGPLANDIDSLRIFMKTVIDAKPALYDGAVIDAPWRSLTKKPKLRLGAVKALQSQGHEIVTLDASECRVGEASQIMTQLVALDTTAASILEASGEPPVQCLSNFSDKVSKIGWDFLPDLSGKDRLDRYGTLEYIRAEIAEAWRKLWVKHNLDAVISPSAQHTAVEHDNFGWPAYSAFLNLLDYPACIIPFGKASKIDVEFVAEPGQGAPPYNPEAVAGAPSSIQVFTSRMRDEECLAAAEVIDDCFKQSVA